MTRREDVGEDREEVSKVGDEKMRKSERANMHSATMQDSNGRPCSMKCEEFCKIAMESSPSKITIPKRCRETLEPMGDGSCTIAVMYLF